MQEALTAHLATGAMLREPYYRCLLAEAYVDLGEVGDALRLLAEAKAAIDLRTERWWEAEVHRLAGEVLLRQDANRVAAEQCFQEALGVASRQQAKSLELRAASSLARLWRNQGKRSEARELLSPVYDWFNEGLNTPDLQEVGALVEEMN